MRRYSLPALPILGALAAWSLFAAGGVAVPAQETTLDLTPRQKEEAFIHHLVKVGGLEPSRYKGLVLQYEIGRALEDLAVFEARKAAGEGGHAGHAHGPGEACDAQCRVLGGDDDFIRTALVEIYPEYAKAVALREQGDRQGALRAALGLLTGGNPYVAAYARLLAAELEVELAGADLTQQQGAAIISKCEHIMKRERIYLIPDYRACELIAKVYAQRKKPLFEFLQYLLLVTDYDNVPEKVKKRIEARLAELSKQNGRPLTTVAGWMNRVEKLLSDEITEATPTQKEEGRIVAALDKLIELQEARERQACKSCGSGQCKDGACKGKRPGPPKGNRSWRPAQVSQLAEAEGRFLLHGVSRGDPRSKWGQLKAKDASRILQGYSGKLPPRYERLLKQYYENLSKTKGAGAGSGEN